MKDRRYVFIDRKDVRLINFNKVMQTSPLTMQYSIDGSKTFVKYVGDQPDFIYNITKDSIGLKEYNNSEMLEILAGPEWTIQ